MCGIVGYIGNKSAVSFLIDGLKRLEYRGYDSAGIAVIDNGDIQLFRSVGKLKALEDSIAGKKIHGSVGIGHTRWATHGKPSEDNAHPHTSCNGDIVVIHNGIIENYLALRDMLTKKGHSFASETDTEVIVHLIEEYYENDIEDAVRKALLELEGAYALGVISSMEPDKIIGARNASPLIMGIGEDEYFIASDVPALLSYTRNVIYLDDFDVVVATRDGYKIKNLQTWETLQKEVVKVAWDPVMAEKGGYKHFMLKEIYEQPRGVGDTLRSRLLEEDGNVYLEDLKITPEELCDIKKIFIVACGTSWHTALLGKFYLESMSDLPVEVDIGSEFRYRNPKVDSHTLLIVISQSGETADTLASLREGNRRGAKSIAICNVLGSSVTRETTDGVIYTHAGPEIGVASTKAFTCQAVAIYIFGVFLGRSRKTLDAKKGAEYISEIKKLPLLIENVLKHDKDLENMAVHYAEKSDFLFLGRGMNYPIALEGALKLKEISYIHAEGYPAGEMKHGPIALISKDMPVVVLATKNSVYDKMIANIEEVKARDGEVIAFFTEDDPQRMGISDRCFTIPHASEFVAPIVLAVPLQLLAYHIAVRRGCDVDQPRNLAKSVTVE